MKLYIITNRSGHKEYLVAENLLELSKNIRDIDSNEKIKCICDIEILGQNNGV
jgi:hypothetical protein